MKQNCVWELFNIGITSLFRTVGVKYYLGCRFKSLYRQKSTIETPKWWRTKRATVQGRSRFSGEVHQHNREEMHGAATEGKYEGKQVPSIPCSSKIFGWRLY